MEIRANLARTLGNHGKHLAPFRKALIEMLEDSSPRVASLAAIALSNHGHKDAVEQRLRCWREQRTIMTLLSAMLGSWFFLNAPQFAPEWKILTIIVRQQSAAPSSLPSRRHKSHLLETYFTDRDQSVRQEAIRAAYEMDVRKTYQAAFKPGT